MASQETVEKMAKAMAIIETAISDASEAGCDPLMIAAALIEHSKAQAHIGMGAEGMRLWIKQIALAV